MRLAPRAEVDRVVLIEYDSARCGSPQGLPRSATITAAAAATCFAECATESCSFVPHVYGGISAGTSLNNGVRDEVTLAKCVQCLEVMRLGLSRISGTDFVPLRRSCSLRGNAYARKDIVRSRDPFSFFFFFFFFYVRDRPGYVPLLGQATVAGVCHRIGIILIVIAISRRKKQKKLATAAVTDLDRPHLRLMRTPYDDGHRPRPARKIVITDSTCQSYDREDTRSTLDRVSKASRESSTRQEMHPFRLAVVIAVLLFASAVIAQLVRWRTGTSRAFFRLPQPFNLDRVEALRVFVQGGQPVVCYRGIPYALPPVGELRFRPSVPATGIGSPVNGSREPAINLKGGRHSCLQDGGPLPSWLQTRSEELSEDCLHLNLWTPDTSCMSSQRGHECGNRTVVVFIHGGDLRYTGNRAYDGAALSSLGDLVVAIPNYRLGLLGRPVGTADSIEHLGIGDQLTALRWLRDNVGLFGGNASQMVLVGHGAGAASVGHLMLARHPELASVRRYVMLSGSPYLEHPAVTLRKLRILAHRLRCEIDEETPEDAGEELSCLRKVPTAALRRRLVGLSSDLFEISTSMDDASDATHYSPRRGGGESRTLLLGTAADEGFFFVDHVTSRSSEPEYVLRRVLKSQGVRDVAAFLEKYKLDLNSTNATVLWSEAYADVKYRCPVQMFADAVARRGVASVYRFVVKEPPPSSFADDSGLRGEATHYAAAHLLFADAATLRTEDVGLRTLFVRALAWELPPTVTGGKWIPYNEERKSAVMMDSIGFAQISMDVDYCRHLREHGTALSNSSLSERALASGVL
ncbi:hypothetical protein HPB50_025805 [Hyalomma asiaticum]|uniref:Uncharacterized protein n=1 Tax=Hyalomma asiaticum TaxID=266040 RepID=A0ACB7STR2_HYAAI|nr:hypothetical protein HPB50_025805 [Hyalomma asiaticum]